MNLIHFHFHVNLITNILRDDICVSYVCVSKSIDRYTSSISTPFLFLKLLLNFQHKTPFNIIMWIFTVLMMTTIFFLLKSQSIFLFSFEGKKCRKKCSENCREFKKCVFIVRISFPMITFHKDSFSPPRP